MLQQAFTIPSSYPLRLSSQILVPPDSAPSLAYAAMQTTMGLEPCIQQPGTTHRDSSKLVRPANLVLPAVASTQFLASMVW